jgi:tetratricopeptide (TPR) repeat protein
MAQLHIENLQYDAAEHHEAQALATFRRASSRRDIAWSLAHMGEIALARGNTSEAKAYWEEALAYFLETGEHNAICTALNSLARIAREIGDPLSARKKIIAGLHLAQDRHRPYVLAHGLYELAGLQLEFGHAGFTSAYAEIVHDNAALRRVAQHGTQPPGRRIVRHGHMARRGNVRGGSNRTRFRMVKSAQRLDASTRAARRASHRPMYGCPTRSTESQ